MDYSIFPKIELKFVSYTGRYPNLCSGTLVLSLNGENIEFPSYCLESGGTCNYRKNKVSKGEWGIREWPEGFPEYLRSLAIELVNQNIDHGCCGGCL